MIGEDLVPYWNDFKDIKHALGSEFNLDFNETELELELTEMDELLIKKYNLSDEFIGRKLRIWYDACWQDPEYANPPHIQNLDEKFDKATFIDTARAYFGQALLKMGQKKNLNDLMEKGLCPWLDK